ncbi:MAG: hypothetical protein ACRD1T_11435, partial [Acidimicrobiia bacterium]
MRKRSLRAAILTLVAIAFSIPAQAGHGPRPPVITLNPNCGVSSDQANAVPSVALISPQNEAIVNFATVAGRTFSWKFSDADPTDSQSAYAFRRWADQSSWNAGVDMPESASSSSASSSTGSEGSAGAAEPAYQWWNASKSTWVNAEIFNSGSPNTIAFPSGSWQNLIEYRWTVSAKDSFGGVSQYPAERMVTGSAPPNAPTLISPAAGATIDIAMEPGRTFKWQFSDPDQGDSQTAWAFRRQKTSAANQPLLYWNVSSKTFQPTEVFNPGPAQQVIFDWGDWE